MLGRTYSLPPLFTKKIYAAAQQKYGGLMNPDVSLLPDERLDKINENLSLIQLKNGLTFGTDAYLLAAFTRPQRAAGADLGSGTGVAAFLCLSKNKFPHMHTFEIQPRFADLIQRNAALNGLSERITVHNADVRSALPKDTGGWLDGIISNPPYMKDGSGFSNVSDTKNIARREVYGTIEDFCAGASSLLKHGGLFTVVYRPDRLADLFYAMRKTDLEPKRIVLVYSDTVSPPSLVLAEGKKGAASSLVWARPLIIYQTGTRTYTADMDKVYETCSMDFLFER